MERAPGKNQEASLIMAKVVMALLRPAPRYR